MTRRLRVVYTFLLLTGFHSICWGAIEVTDALGRTVVLEKPAQRVVALAPHIVENVFAAGAGSTLVGVSEHSDYPAAAARIDRIGNSQTVNIESVLALKPDLVITWHSGRAVRLLSQFEKLGLAVYASDPKRLSDIPKTLRDFGLLTGYASEAEKAALAFETRLNQLRLQYRKPDEDPLPVFHQVWADPLQTLNGEHIVSEILTLCGARNIFADADAIAPRVSTEAVIAANPAAILSTWEPGDSPYPLAKWRKWPSILAVKREALYTIQPDLLHRNSPRILLGVEQVCEHLAQARKKP